MLYRETIDKFMATSMWLFDRLVVVTILFAQTERILFLVFYPHIPRPVNSLLLTQKLSDLLRNVPFQGFLKITHNCIKDNYFTFGFHNGDVFVIREIMQNALNRYA